MIPSSDDTIELFYEAAMRPGALPQTLAAMRAFLRAEAGAIYMEPSTTPSVRSIDDSTLAVTGHSAARLDDYVAHYSALNPFVPIARRRKPGWVLSDSLVDPAVVDGEFFFDWARPQGLRHVIGQCLARHDGGMLMVALWRESGAGAFEPSVVAGLPRIGRHLSRAIEIGGRLRAAEAAMEAQGRAEDAALFTLAADAGLRHANGAGEALLSAGDGLALAAGRLRASHAEDRGALDGLIARALHPLSGSAGGSGGGIADPEAEVVALRRPGRRPPLAVRAMRTQPGRGLFAPDPAARVVVVAAGAAEGAPLALAAPPEEILRRRFGLTPAQARVARALAEGRSARDVAAALGVSHETIRSHLKALFDLTGARRQVDLALSLRRALEGATGG